MKFASARALTYTTTSLINMKIESELEKMWSRLTPEEASTEVSKIFDAAKRKLCAAEHTVRKSARFIKAIGKAREKRPMTGKTSLSCYT